MRYLFITLLILTTSVWAGGTDQRQVIQLNPEQRNFVLTEMRSLLSGLEKILTAIHKNDMAAVEKASRTLGFGMKHKAENPLHEVLPKNFMQMGMAMHKEFDKIADDARLKKDHRRSLLQVSEVLSKCNACHLTFQIQLTPSK